MAHSSPSSTEARKDLGVTVPKTSPINRSYLYGSDDGMNRSRSLTPRRFASCRPKPVVRTRLHQYNTIDDAAALLKSSRSIIVLTGAGISTSLGIPDFRSSQGLYQILKASSDYDDPQELFHIENFYNDPAKFYKNVAPIIPKISGVTGSSNSGVSKESKKPISDVSPRFSPTHAFLALLQAKEKLLTNYTQNIDGLEVAAGVSTSKLIQCHGTWATATCISCGKKSSARKYLPVVYANGVPFCKCSSIPALRKPSSNRKTKKNKKRKRHEYEDTDSSEDISTSGQPSLLKPDITFFGEEISESYRPRLDSDKSEVDLLLIIGTSLKVAPVNEMLTSIPASVPQIWISKDRCQRDGVKVDIELLGECDVIVQELCRRAGWTKSLDRRLWKDEQQQKNHNISNDKADDALPLRKKESSQATGNGTPVSQRKSSNSNTSTSLTVRPTTGLSQTPQRQTIPSQKENGKLDGSNKAHQPTKEEVCKPITERVIVEVEEGTEHRCFIRRVK